MKRLLLLSVAFTGLVVCFTSDVNAQGVGINASGNSADSSAILDASSTTKGALIPRMTTAQMNLIVSPANGLIVYNTDCNMLFFNAGTPSLKNWVPVYSSIVAGVNIVANPSGTICPGTNVTFTATSVNGGSSPVYQWKVNGTNTGSNSNTYTSSTLSNGDQVTCVVTSNAACVMGSPATSNTITMSVNVNSSVSISGTTTICSGSNTTLSASGSGTYLWSTTATTAAITVSPATNTAYTVTVTSSGGCTGTASTTVTVNPSPTASISGATKICGIGSTTLTASGGGTYLWSTTATTAAITVSPTTNTTYMVTVTSSGGCTATASATVTVSSSPTASISGTTTICSGNSTTLTASGGGTYLWSTTATTAAITVSPTATTTYSVTVTSSGGCTATASATVTVSGGAITQDPNVNSVAFGGNETNHVSITTTNANDLVIVAVMAACSPDFNGTVAVTGAWTGAATAYQSVAASPEGSVHIFWFVAPTPGTYNITSTASPCTANGHFDYALALTGFCNTPTAANLVAYNTATYNAQGCVSSLSASLTETAGSYAFGAYNNLFCSHGALPTWTNLNALSGGTDPNGIDTSIGGRAISTAGTPTITATDAGSGGQYWTALMLINIH